MNIDEAIAFTRDNHRAVLSTRRRDGRPQLSPITVAPGGAGQVIISTRETAMKVKNVERDARVSICAFTDAWFGAHAQLDGEAEIIRLPDALEPLVEYYRSVSGEHPDWDEYRAAMVRDRRVLLQVTVTDAGPNAAGSMGELRWEARLPSAIGIVIGLVISVPMAIRVVAAIGVQPINVVILLGGLVVLVPSVVLRIRVGTDGIEVWPTRIRVRWSDIEWFEAAGAFGGTIHLHRYGVARPSPVTIQPIGPGRARDLVERLNDDNPAP